MGAAFYSRLGSELGVFSKQQKFTVSLGQHLSYIVS
jgi:hypothetical protein